MIFAFAHLIYVKAVHIILAELAIMYRQPHLIRLCLLRGHKLAWAVESTHSGGSILGVSPTDISARRAAQRADRVNALSARCVE